MSCPCLDVLHLTCPQRDKEMKRIRRFKKDTDLIDRSSYLKRKMLKGSQTRANSQFLWVSRGDLSTGRSRVRTPTLNLQSQQEIPSCFVPFSSIAFNFYAHMHGRRWWHGGFCSIFWGQWIGLVRSDTGPQRKAGPRQANGIAESCCLAAGFLWRGGVVVGFQADL